MQHVHHSIQARWPVATSARTARVRTSTSLALLSRHKEGAVEHRKAGRNAPLGDALNLCAKQMSGHRIN